MTIEGLAPDGKPEAAPKAQPQTRAHGFVVESIRVIVPLLILAAGLGFLMISGKLKKTATRPPSVSGPPRVQTAAVSAYEGEMSLDVDGLVVPFREMTLTSEVAGRVKMKSSRCRAGHFVKAGELLLVIDPIDYELELKRLRQELRQAEISVHEIDVQLENIKQLALLAEQEKGLQADEVRRMRALAGDRIVAKSEFDRARSEDILSRNAVQLLANEARVLVARRASMEAAIELAKTRIEQAELDVARTKITAPVDGVIVGELVEEGAFVQRGAAVLMFEDTSAVEVKCNLMNEELAWLTRGQPADAAYGLPNTPAKIIFRRGAQNFVWDGKLSRFDGLGLDQKTRMFPCRILVNNPTGGRLLTTASVVDQQNRATAPPLMRGMYVTVSIQVPSQKPLAQIPRKALQLGNVVWRVRNEHLNIAPVKVAKRNGNSVLIELPRDDQLRLDDRIVVSPLTTVVDGMAVKVIDVPEAAASEELEMTSERVDEADNSRELEPGAAT